MAADSYGKNLTALVKKQINQELAFQLEQIKDGIAFNQNLAQTIRTQLKQDAPDYRVFQYQQKEAKDDLVTPPKLVQRGIKALPGYACIHGPDTFARCVSFVNDNPGTVSGTCTDT